MEKTMTTELTQEQFERISGIVYRICGIDLHSGKEVLVRARLAKRLRALSLTTFDQYMEHLDNDTSGSELTTMIDSLTTNKTYFFRESQHFDHLGSSVLPELQAKGAPIRIWSAGCSTGEEPYTLAIVAKKHLPNSGSIDLKILATDISFRVLQTAREGVYQQDQLQDVPVRMMSDYFTCIQPKTPREYRVKDNLRSIIKLARLNLMESWPMKGPFQVIFCRNVMIYFDKATQERLVQRYWDILAPGGYLYVGHSESLTATSHRFKYIGPAIYRK